MLNSLCFTNHLWLCTPEQNAMRQDGWEEAERCAVSHWRFAARQPLQQQLEAMQADFEALGAHWSALKRRTKPQRRGILPKVCCLFLQQTCAFE